MKIFISWSGNRSKAVAEVISDWIKCVIQASQPWISTRDIDRGAIWFSEINEKLKDTSIGIVCLTQDNKNKPWILFEAGALTKGLTTNRVCTFLIDLEPTDLKDPLAQFNHTTPQRGSVWELVRTINSCLGDKMLDERILSQVFETYWNKFDSDIKNAIKENPATEEVIPRSEQDLLTEILNNTRGLSRRVNDLEILLEEKSIKDSRSRSLTSVTTEKIYKYIKSGMSPSEILLKLGDQGLPDGLILDLIKKLTNENYSKNNNININGGPLGLSEVSFLGKQD